MYATNTLEKTVCNLKPEIKYLKLLHKASIEFLNESTFLKSTSSCPTTKNFRKNIRGKKNCGRTLQLSVFLSVSELVNLSLLDMGKH